MKSNFNFVLVHKDMSKDNIYVPFKGTLYQAQKAFYPLTFALNSSPFCKLFLTCGDGLVVTQSELKGDY